jgi:ATP-dependent protease ClpP protease subunit
MAPEEAITYGLIDGVIDAAPDVALPTTGAARR